MILVGGGLAAICASLYGHWLNVDTVQHPQPVDAIVLMGGYHRHELAADWVRQGQSRSIWIFVSPPPTLVKLGVQKSEVDVSRQQLQKLGVPLARIQEFSSTAAEHDLPGVLRELGEVCRQQGAQRVVVTCQSLEARPLRQIADAAMAPAQRPQIQFLSLPSDRYRASLWWLSRTGLKEGWNQTMQVLSNWWDGPTNGFDDAGWDPETWEPPSREVSR